jgi:hypothetical protein
MCKRSSTGTIRRQMRGVLSVIVLLAVVSVGCGRKSSPAGPSPTPDPPPTTTTFTVSGKVLDKTDDSLVPGARIEIVTGDTADKVAVADAEGSYRLVDLPPGSYALRAVADGFDPSSSSLTLTGDRVLDFTLTRWTGGGSAPEPPPGPAERWTLAGTVTDASSQSPLAGVRIEITDGVNRGRVVTTDEQGEYTLADLEPGAATVRAACDDFTPKSATVTIQADRALDFRLERVAAPGPSGPAISGRTVDALSEQPIAGVVVRIEGAGEATTNGNGEFTVTAADSSGTQRVTLTSASTVERHTQIHVPGGIPAVTLIPRSLDLRAFDQMLRARGGLHRWVEAPRLVVQRSVLTFTGTSEMSYTATADSMSEAEADELVADLAWALPQLTGLTFSSFAGVEVERADEGDAVSISRPGVIVVARYAGLNAAISAWGYGRWAWNGAGEVQAGALMLDNDFEQSNSPYRRSLRAHELGHALGYDHVSGGTSVMDISGRIEPTAFDRDATTIAFRRRPLNLSPDTDPDPITVNRMRSVGTLRWEGAR